jgi:hypothetical protein
VATPPERASALPEIIYYLSFKTFRGERSMKIAAKTRAAARCVFSFDRPLRVEGDKTQLNMHTNTHM